MKAVSFAKKGILALIALAGILVCGLFAEDAKKAEPTPKEKLEKKLKKTVIPGAEVQNCSVGSIMAHINARTKELDGSESGVNIVLIIDHGGLEKQACSSLKEGDISLDELMAKVCKDAKLEMRVEDYAVVVGTKIEQRLKNAVKREGDTKEIDKKLREIIIDHMEFEEVKTGIVLGFMSQRAQQIDPEKKGVPIQYDPPSPTELASSDEGPVTMVCDNVPLGELLRYVAAQAGGTCVISEKGVTFKVPGKKPAGKKD